MSCLIVDIVKSIITPFVLTTDASKYELGAILSQLDEKGHEKAIHFASRTTNKHEQNYATTQLECLAVVWGIKMFHSYLLGRHFTVITDHSALQGLINSTEPSGMFARWVMHLQQYDFTIKHRRGIKNKNADALSRTSQPRKEG